MFERPDISVCKCAKLIEMHPEIAYVIATNGGSSTNIAKSGHLGTVLNVSMLQNQNEIIELSPQPAINFIFITVHSYTLLCVCVLYKTLIQYNEVYEFKKTI